MVEETLELNGKFDGARKAAEAFLNAVVAGDEGGARELLILGEGETLDFESMSASVGSFQLGEPQAEGDSIVVVAAITPRPGQDAPPALPLVMTRRAGPWKVDMGASMQKLMGGLDLQAIVEQMAKGLGEAMEGIGAAMAEGLGAQAEEAPAKPAKLKSKPKKAAPKRTVVKKAAKKRVVKKAGTKKPVAKKPVARKTAAKKQAAKKVAKKKAPATKVAARKRVAKKVAPKKATKKKAPAKKAPAKKVAKKVIKKTVRKVAKKAVKRVPAKKRR